MKLKEYIENLNKFAKDNPEALDLTVISSKDDEGNGFNEVYVGLAVGCFDEEDGGYFTSKKELEEEYGEDPEEWGINEINAVCIN